MEEILEQIELIEGMEIDTRIQCFLQLQELKKLKVMLQEQVKKCSLPDVSGNSLEVAKQIPQVPQTQISLNDQLKILRVAANKLGLYDAADFIKRD